ncbi:MAG: phosphoribosylformylglycinamidine synthase subunit PurS [Bacteroidota bacterium]|jgi:phosphoribosylformylglycinamidine synthase|uniref:phosphoribosylformylglycinamidine synthase subunit PurS n=1 Tax=Candidatus Pollutiaquabacter sp. TaxID=3416354 RepID=UPI001A4E87CC|nr:phosphoribosylformylglycinamidine synthase subunit PurS [Bacteroidota bacterium]MBL7947440.1 phosphoribosylformylglycinamidine synthase subunit PurS [Bacteroidia bacterium]MBP6010158.1 phosphoribosylformylglycinamidine synthase subunit PurS [Bacteroidia bacterium]MBP7270256.1 phosphoribosylformylglycinamidine synthase subunit PurS [Bacteroidia bacterium]MBP7436955.1 phosphoribosylformylglycinamidine synthase subunit PurS [Bacteroidia bacterium]
MKFIAEIDVMPLKALLDPQGKAVTHGLQNMGYATMENVRVGKHISLEIDADSREAANQQVEEACKKLLANPIMESFHFVLNEAK